MASDGLQQTQYHRHSLCGCRDLLFAPFRRLGQQLQGKDGHHLCADQHQFSFGVRLQQRLRIGLEPGHRGQQRLYALSGFALCSEGDKQSDGEMEASSSNIVIALEEAGYDGTLWSKYDIIKRTKDEERAAFGK